MANNPMSVALKVDFALLNTNLNAIYEKDGQNGSTILVIPTNIATPAAPVSIGDITKSFQELFSNQTAGTDIENSLSSLSSSGENSFEMSKITFSLRAAYLYKTIQTEGKEGDNDITEYAFAIDIDLSGAIPKFPLGTINGVSLAVWNTPREGILANMNMGSAAQLLAAIS